MPPETIRFFLDESLPPRVARELAGIGHSITHPEVHGKRGAKDPDLISWLAQNQFAWITKDHAAKRVHGDQLKREGVSVVWVRGLGGTKNAVNAQQVHLMLTVGLPRIVEKMKDATGPMYFVLSLTKRGPKLVALSDDDVGSGEASRARMGR